MDDNEKKETLADNFPSNSRAQKPAVNSEKTTEDKKVERVVTGKVKKQKRGFGKKVAETLCEDDTKSVGSYIIYDVLIPAAKDMLSDMVGGGVDMLLFGERRGGRGRRDRGDQHHRDPGVCAGRRRPRPDRGHRRAQRRSG